MAIGKRVLIVDNETCLLQMLDEQLAVNDEFVPSIVTSGADAIKIAKKVVFDVIIVVDGLLDISSKNLCKLLRRGGINTPVILIVDAKIILNQEIEFNDYIIKPFRLGSLFAKMRFLIRQQEREDDSLIIGPFSFHPNVKLLIDLETNERVRLTDKEAAILKFLYRTQGKVVSRNVLLGEVWGYNSEVTTHTLETHVYRLRQKIEKIPSNAKILLTEPGGYRLAP